MDLVVEDVATGFCGAVVLSSKQAVTLEDRNGVRRNFPLHKAGFLFEGRPVTLVHVALPVSGKPQRTASGSVAVAHASARVAKASRIWVEGVHDAELVERIWGDDLRIEGIVVEPLHGIDELVERVHDFAPGSGRRLGVLVDHLVPGSKESRIVDSIRNSNVLITGHPYIDIWQAIKPASLGISEWPDVPRGIDWKTGVCAQLGFGDPMQGWRRVRAAARSYSDVQAPLLGAVERLIDFTTMEH